MEKNLSKRLEGEVNNKIEQLEKAKKALRQLENDPTYGFTFFLEDIGGMYGFPYELMTRTKDSEGKTALTLTLLKHLSQKLNESLDEEGMGEYHIKINSTGNSKPLFDILYENETIFRFNLNSKHFGELWNEIIIPDSRHIELVKEKLDVAISKLEVALKEQKEPLKYLSVIDQLKYKFSKSFQERRLKILEEEVQLCQRDIDFYKAELESEKERVEMIRERIEERRPHVEKLSRFFISLYYVRDNKSPKLYN